MKAKIHVIGTGPGNIDYICPKALDILKESDLIIGYKTYIDLLKPCLPNKKFISSGMRKEVERCQYALDMAEKGHNVSIVSSGDPGIYGMAGIMIEIASKRNSDIEVITIPGISAASSAASLLGAPLMNDYVTISLSDLLTPWPVIEKRINAAIAGDFVIALYNPRSKKRTAPLENTVKILSQNIPANTPVGIVKHAMREGQEIFLTDIEHMSSFDIDMFTVIIIGNSHTKIRHNKMVTERGYIL